MQHFPSKNRPAFTLIELLVVIAILVVSASLLLSAIQVGLGASARAQCLYNLRQLGLAAHSAHDTNRRLPPGIGFYPGSNNGPLGTFFFHLLPYIEKNSLFASAQQGDTWSAWNNNVNGTPIASYRCPADTTAGNGVLQGVDGSAQSWATGTYVVNVQIVCQVDGTGALVSPQGAARIPMSIPDGISNTLLFAERLAICTNSFYPEGGTLPFYDSTDPDVAVPLHAGIFINWNTNSIGPQARFAVQPASGNCDPTQGATPHSAMNVCLVDGSVRTLTNPLNTGVWWALATPAGGEVIPLAE